MSIDATQSRLDPLATYQNVLTSARSETLMRKEGILPESASSTELLGALLAVLASTEEEMGVEASSTDAFVADLYDEFRKGRCLLGTPLLTNIANGPDRPLGSCSAAPIDPRGSEFDQEEMLERYYAQNMGSGMNLDAAPDPCLMVVRLNEHAAAFEGSGNCERYVGNIAHIDIDHPRILEFIELKSNIANLIHFNLSINVTESFQSALNSGGSWRLRDGTKISAPLLWNRIAASAWSCGDPGLIWLDRYNRQNALSGICDYTTVAPCAEVGLSPGETCVFGYLNLAAFTRPRGGQLEVDMDAIDSTTRLLVRALDAAITYSYRHQPTSISSRQSFQARKIGIGVCGWSDLLLWLGMDYGSTVSDGLLSKILSVVTYSSKRESADLSRARGTFGAFYLSQLALDTSNFLSRYVRDSQVIEQVDWLKLIGDIKAHGIRHSMTTALPPSGRTALLLNVNTSIEPFLTLRPGGQWVPPVESLLREGAVKLDGDRGLMTTLPGQLEGWPQSASSEVSLFRESVRIPPKQHMATAAVACHWTDDSVSKTVNLASSSSPSDVIEVFDAALRLGFKAISVYRANSHPSEFAQEKLGA